MATSFKAVSQARTNDRDGNGITSQVVGNQRGLDVNVIGGDITIDNAEINVELDAQDGDNVAIHSSSTGDELIIHPNGSTDVNVIDSVLPDGAATEATLLLAAASLTNLDTWELSGLPEGNNNIGNVDVLTLPNVTLASQANPFTTALPISGVVDTELPAAVTLADGTADPTAPAVGAFMMGWDPYDDDWKRIMADHVIGTVVGGFAVEGQSALPGREGLFPIAGLNSGSYTSIEVDDFNAMKTALYDVAGGVIQTSNPLPVGGTKLTTDTTPGNKWLPIAPAVLGLTPETAGAVYAPLRVNSSYQLLVNLVNAIGGSTVFATSSAVGGDSTNGLDVDVTRVTGTVTTSSKVALTASSPTAATVGVTSAQAVASNSSRKGLVLTNTSTGKISFGIGATAVLNSGITLTPGGVWVMDEYTYATGAINAIAEIASSNLAIQEFV